MQAIVMRQTGGPEVLVPEDVPRPAAGPGQVLVRSEAIAVSRGESLIRSGAIPLRTPAVLGAEAVGIVEEVGEGVEPGLLGARVAVVTGGTGSYAEYVTAPAGLAARVPEGLSAIDAVAVAGPGATALGLLHRAGLQEGETIIVVGASGAVGGYLVRLVRDLGAGRVIATAGAALRRDRAPELGADVVLDHTSPDWATGLAAALDGATLDVVFDPVGGSASGQLLDHLTPSSGRMVCYGMLSGTPPDLDMANVTRRGLHIIGCGGPGWFREVIDVHYPEILERASRGGIEPRVAGVLPLAEAAEAHRRLESVGVSGRLVLVP
jgi:NADPH:quinone reductase